MSNKRLPHKSFTPYLALLGTIIIWAAALPVIKITLEEVPPFTFLLLRFTLVAILMLPVVAYETRTNPIHRADIKNLILLGIFGQASLALLFIGLKYTSTIDTALIGTAAPLMTIFAGHYFYHDKVSKVTKFGVAIATLGTALVVFEPILMGGINHNSTATELRMLGNILVVIYNVFSSIFIIFSKVVMGTLTKEVKGVMRYLHVNPMKKDYSPTLLTGITFYVGLAAIIPLALFENLGYFGPISFSIYAIDNVAIAGILYMAILSSIVAYIAYQWGIKGVDATDTAIFGYLGPLFTIPFSFLLLGEIPTRLALMGATIIAMGVFIAEKYRKV